MTATDVIAGERPAPIAPKDRIFTLDMLRGWAILGILGVNAMAFAWPMALEMDPTLAPPWPHDHANIVGEWVKDVFFQDKFRSLFSMLFGVSIFLIGGARYDEARSPLLLRRLMWLGLFGLIHGFALWFGDILLHYAYTGLLVMIVRSWSARRLIWTGVGLNLVFAVLSAGSALLAGMMAGAPEASGGNPFAMAQDQLTTLIQTYQSGWPGAQIENLKAAVFLQLMSLTLVPITAGLMMLGLGLFKSGFLTGRSPTWLYVLLLLIGGANLAVFGWYDWQLYSAP
ncbi:MAG: DUF418 domain-containing protein, partial [Brevundimonas sp.]